MDTVTVRVFQEEHAQGLPLPAYATSEAAGMDLIAAVGADRPVVISPGERCLLPTGLRMQIPAGFEGQIRPRSGLALKYGIGMVNAPGTIDADYRGEVQVLLINHGQQPFEVRRGDRIAQMIISPVVHSRFEVCAMPEDLNATERGSGGFGSTGVELIGE